MSNNCIIFDEFSIDNNILKDNYDISNNEIITVQNSLLHSEYFPCMTCSARGKYIDLDEVFVRRKSLRKLYSAWIDMHLNSRAVTLGRYQCQSLSSLKH